jgi:hypothetical protein
MFAFASHFSGKTWNFRSFQNVELVPTVMIDDLDKSCAKAEPNFDKWNVKTSVVWLEFSGFTFYTVKRFGLECLTLSRDLSLNINQHKLAHKPVKCDKMVLMFLIRIVQPLRYAFWFLRHRSWELARALTVCKCIYNSNIPQLKVDP